MQAFKSEFWCVGSDYEVTTVIGQNATASVDSLRLVHQSTDKALSPDSTKGPLPRRFPVSARGVSTMGGRNGARGNPWSFGRAKHADLSTFSGELLLFVFWCSARICVPDHSAWPAWKNHYQKYLAVSGSGGMAG